MRGLDGQDDDEEDDDDDDDDDGDGILASMGDGSSEEESESDDEPAVAQPHKVQPQTHLAKIIFYDILPILYDILRISTVFTLPSLCSFLATQHITSMCR